MIEEPVYQIFKSERKFKYSHIKIRHGTINDPLTWETISLPLEFSSIESLCWQDGTPFEYELDGQTIPAENIRRVSFYDKDDDLSSITEIPKNFLNYCNNLQDIDLTYLKYVRKINEDFLTGCTNIKVIRTGFINAKFVDIDNILKTGAIWLSGDIEFNQFGPTNTEYKPLPTLKSPKLPELEIIGSQVKFNFIEDSLYTHYTLSYRNISSEEATEIEIKNNEHVLSLKENTEYYYNIKGHIGIYSGEFSETNKLKTLSTDNSMELKFSVPPIENIDNLIRWNGTTGTEYEIYVNNKLIKTVNNTQTNIFLDFNTNHKIYVIDRVNKKMSNIIEANFYIAPIYTNELSILNNDMQNTPENLLSEIYGNNDKLSIDQIAFRHSGTTWQPAANYISVITENNEKVYKCIQSQNANVENLYLWNYDLAFRTKRDAETNWVAPCAMKFVGNSNENGTYTLSIDIKYPAGKTGLLNISPVVKARNATSGSISKPFTGTGNWQRIYVSVNMTTENPYAYFQINANTALNGEAFYIKNMMFCKENNTKYYPSHLYDTGYKHPFTGYEKTVMSETGMTIISETTNLSNIINQTVSPYCNIRFTAGFTNAKGGIGDIRYNFSLNANSKIKQINFNPVFRKNSDAAAIQLEQLNTKLFDTIQLRDLNDGNYPANWDGDWNTTIFQQRNYVMRDTLSSKINDIKNINTTHINFEAVKSGTGALNATIAILFCRVFYTLPESRYESIQYDISNFIEDIPYNIIKTINVNDSSILFFDENNKQIGTLADTDIKQKLITIKKFTVRLWNILDTTILPNEILKFIQYYS